jgi:uncharacterized protein (UPF0332 family)
VNDTTTLRPDRLLDHARQLARRGADTASPRTVHARRAVSAAYYALFHQVTINLARRASTGLPDAVGWALCRTFSHTKLREATDLMTRRPDELRRSTRATLTTDLVDRALDDEGMAVFARGFGPLQQARHEADYDHTTVIDRTTSERRVQDAEALVRIVEGVYEEPAWQAFTTLVLLKTNLVHHA